MSMPGRQGRGGSVMTERCSGATRSRFEEWSEREEGCDAPKEDGEAVRKRCDREAEARQSRWIQSDEGAGGMSRAAMSTLGEAPVACAPTDAEIRAAVNARAAERTRRIDPPIQSDPIGNALPGLLVGGLLGGLRAAAAGAGIFKSAGAAGKEVAEGVAVEVADHGVRRVAQKHADPHKEGRAAGAVGGARTGEATRGAPGEPCTPHPSPSAEAHRVDPGVAGRSSPKGASETVPEPNKSEAPPLRGQDRVPYRPGEAPFRIPEAPREDAMSMPFVVRG